MQVLAHCIVVRTLVKRLCQSRARHAMLDAPSGAGFGTPLENHRGGAKRFAVRTAALRPRRRSLGSEITWRSPRPLSEGLPKVGWIRKANARADLVDRKRGALEVLHGERPTYIVDDRLVGQSLCSQSAVECAQRRAEVRGNLMDIGKATLVSPSRPRKSRVSRLAPKALFAKAPQATFAK